MIKSTLLITITLFITACSDNTTNKQLPTSNTTEKKALVTQTVTVEKTVASEQLKELPAVVKKEETSISGRAIYVRKCASCHGENGEKTALNKSQVIKDWETKKTINALKGYQNGSYGSSMKGIMKAQVNALSDSQLQAVSEYIATL